MAPVAAGRIGDEVEACGEGIYLLLQKELRAVGLEDHRHVLLVVGGEVLEGSVVEFARSRVDAEAIVVHVGRGTYAINSLDIDDLRGLIRSEVVAVDDGALACEVELVAVSKEGGGGRPTRGNGLVEDVPVEGDEVVRSGIYLEDRIGARRRYPELTILADSDTRGLGG